MNNATRTRQQRMTAAEVVAIHERRAMGMVAVMVVCQVVPAPISSPVVPPPAKAREDTDANSQTERNPWAIDEQAGNLAPTRIERKRCTVDNPRIVFRHVNDLRVCRFNHDCLCL